MDETETAHEKRDRIYTNLIKIHGLWSVDGWPCKSPETHRVGTKDCCYKLDIDYWNLDWERVLRNIVKAKFQRSWHEAN